MIKIIKNQQFNLCVHRIVALCTLVLCLYLSTTANAATGASCSDARTTLIGDYWLNPNQQLWFTGTVQSIADGFSCYWLSSDTIDISVYVNMPLGSWACPGTNVYNTKATPNGIYDFAPDYVKYRIELAISDYGLPAQLVYMSTAYVCAQARGSAGRLFINTMGVAPQSTAQGPFKAVEYNKYLINANTNAYYQVAWHDMPKPDSIYVAWQPFDSAYGFRADLLDKYPKIQFRQKNNAGVSKGTALRIDGTNKFIVRKEAYDVAVDDDDSLVVSFLNVPDDGHFRFLALYNANEETEVVELCAGKSLELSNGSYSESGFYRDTLRGSDDFYSPEYWHRTIRSIDLRVAEPEVKPVIELQVPELPTEYNGFIFTTEGIQNLSLVDADGCSYIQPVNVTLETALNEIEQLGLRIQPANPKAGELMTITTGKNDHALYIYSVSGKLVAQGRVGQPLTAPQQGIYLLRINNKTIKLKIE